MLWLFMIGLLSVNYLTRSNRIPSVNYSQLFPASASEYENKISNKKVMSLGPGWSIYKHNALGGIFLNWEQSKPVFENLDKYRSIEIIASSFELEEPEIILDEHNYMEPIMEKIPNLQGKYKREGEMYFRISN